MSLKWTKIPNSRNDLSCLHVVYKDPVSTNRIAAFDLDDTLISNAQVNWLDRIPNELARLIQEKFTICILTNQLVLPGHDELSWRQKMPAILEKLGSPCYVYAAQKRDYYRKPFPGMIYKHLELYCNGQSLSPDSFYVGDAAGRDGDHNDTDRKMALAAGMHFHTPEEYFLRFPPSLAYNLKYVDFQQIANSSQPQMPFNFTPTNGPELLLLVGYPGSGRTLFYEQFLSTHNYRFENVDSVFSAFKLGSQDFIAARGSYVNSRDGRRVLAGRATKAGLKTRVVYLRVANDRPYSAWRNLVYAAHVPGVSVGVPPPIPNLKAFCVAAADFRPPLATEGLHIVDVPFSYRGPPGMRQLYFQLWCELGEEKNKQYRRTFQ